MLTVTAMTNLDSRGNESRASGFIGRRQELAVLTAALDETLAGRGQMVMLAGEPGIGKTRLAQELVDLAEHRGARILWGWCYEHRGAPPYWPWLQCIRTYIETADTDQLRQDMGPGAADISEILPELTVKLEGLETPPTLEPEQARFRLFFAIITFLKNISRSQPLVLVLDDLHWANESSLLLLEFLAREISVSSIIVVGAYRDDEVSGSHPFVQTLGSLVRESHFQRIPLGGLSRQEVGEFVEARAGATIADAAVDTLHQRTEGNPLFVGEVVGSVGPEEMARDQTWTDSIPEAVRDAILRRLSQLSETCDQLLRTASVIGRNFDLPLLRVLSPEIAEAEFLESLDEALGIRIVEILPAGIGGYQFSHALIQQAVYEEIPPMRKAQAHAAVGEILEGLHSNNLNEHAGELARHFAEAGAVGGTEKLVRYSLIAGEMALDSFGYEQAMVHFSRVLDAKEGVTLDAEMAAAHFGLGRAQAAALPRYEFGEVHLNFTRAFDYYASVGDTARIVAIAEFPLPLLIGPDMRSGQLIERALEHFPDDSIQAGRLHAYHGNVQGMADGDYQSARDSFDRALAIARREGNTALEMRTLNFAAQVEVWNNRFNESLAWSKIAIDLAATASDPRGEVAARYWAYLAAKTLGDREEALRQASAILEPAVRLRDRYWLASAYSAVDWSLALEGNWDSAKEVNQRGLDLMPLDPRLLGQRVSSETQTGNQVQAQVYLEQLEELVRQTGSRPNVGNSCLAVAAPSARSTFDTIGRPNLAESSITAILSSPSATPLFSTWARTGASFLAVLDDDAEAAGEQYAALKASAGILIVHLSMDRVLGLLAGTMGHLDNAMVHFLDAYAFCRKAGYRPELAWTCYDHASVLLRRGGPGDREAAASLLEEGLSIATELGMAPLVDRTAALQRKMGVEPPKSAAYPDGLTQREIDVLQLICGGKTDREIGEDLFISVKTVGNHVSNILNKTNTANRTEAATYAAQHGLTLNRDTDTQ